MVKSRGTLLTGRSYALLFFAGAIVGLAPDCTEAAFLESGGQVVIEAEHFSSNISRGGKTWTLQTSVAGFGGTGYMSALPNTGTAINAGHATTSPELVFSASFTTTGTYYVWVRGSADGGNDDSLHAGVDGTAPASADRMDGYNNVNWVWKRQTLDGAAPTLQIVSPGVHTIHLWMREDGLRVDRLLLRTSSSSTAPSGIGPAESSQSTADSSPPLFSSISAVSFSSTAAVITWQTNEPATTQVEYGLSDEYGETSPLNAALTTSHDVTLSGLAPGIEYHFRVKSQDGAGNPGTSTDQSFVTLADGEGAGIPSGFSILGNTSEPPPGYSHAGVLVAGTDLWIRLSNLNTRGYVSGAAALNKYIYALGGSEGTTILTPPANLERYDAYSPGWGGGGTSVPTARNNLTAETVNDRIYVIGGSATYAGSALDVVEELNPITNTWLTKAPMPTARYSLASAVVDGNIYVLGGSTANSVGTAAVEMYNPSTNTWTPKAPLPTPRWAMAAAAVNGKIYAIGGTVVEGVQDNRVEEYDPATNAWTEKTPMPTARRGARAAVVHDRIYVIGGYIEGSVLGTVEEYDPASDSWSTKPSMPTARQFPAVAVLGNSIYVAGGALTSGDTGVVELYEPRVEYHLHRKQ